MSKPQQRLHITLSIVVLALLLYAISGIIINYNIPGRPDFSIPLVLLFAVVTGCVLASIAFALHKISTHRPKLLLPMMLSFAFLVLCYQAVFAILTYRPIGWDVGHVFRAATSDSGVWGGTYLYVFSHNTLVTFAIKVWTQLTSLVGFSQLWASAVALNVLMMDMSIALIAVWAWREHGRFFGSLVLVYSILLVGLSPNILIPYSDTMGIFFIAAVFVLYRMAAKTQSEAVRYVGLALFGFFSAAGFNMKPTVLIVPIAIVIITALRHLSLLRHWKKIAAMSCACIFGFALFQGLFIYIIRPYTIEDYDREIDATYNTPFYAYFMGGLAHPPEAPTYGGFFDEDAYFIRDLAGDESKADAIMQRTMDRLSRMGFGGLLRLWHYKYNWSMSDGTFYYGLEGDPFSSGDARETEGIHGFLQNFANPDAPYYKNIHINFQQGFWLLTLILAAIGVWLSRKEANNTWDVIMLFILGLSIYLVLFETRSRYVFLALPVYIALACNGVVACTKLLGRRRNSRL